MHGLSFSLIHGSKDKCQDSRQSHQREDFSLASRNLLRLLKKTFIAAPQKFPHGLIFSVRLST